MGSSLPAVGALAEELRSRGISVPEDAITPLECGGGAVSLSLDTIAYTYAPGTRYAQAALLRVSLDVSPGELLLLVGATGSGKSTLLRIAAGLLGAQSGEASIDGEPLTAATARGRVGLVFQNPESQLFADTVLGDVAFGPRNLGLADDEADDRAREALDAVGLDAADVRLALTLRALGRRGPSRRDRRCARDASALPPARRAHRRTRRPGAASRAREHRAGPSRGGRSWSSATTPRSSSDRADRVLVLEGGAPAFSGTPDELLADPSPLVAAGVGLPPLVEVQVLARRSGCVLERLSATPPKLPTR